MVKNTPTVTATTVHTTLSGTVAAITTPAVAPRIVAASPRHARRVEAPADPAMTTYAVHATRRLCSFPNDLAIRPAAAAATATCIARTIVGARVASRRRRIRAGLVGSGGRTRGFSSAGRDGRCGRESYCLRGRLGDKLGSVNDDERCQCSGWRVRCIAGRRCTGRRVVKAVAECPRFPCDRVQRLRADVVS